jgi:hypothetical protein
MYKQRLRKVDWSKFRVEKLFFRKNMVENSQELNLDYPILEKKLDLFLQNSTKAIFEL